MNTTNRRKFIATAVTVAAGTAAASAITVTDVQKKHPVVHQVFFWLKNPASSEDRDKLIAGLKTLSKIETVKGLRVGVVASTEKRDVVDNSWSVSELIFFNDLDEQAVYQSHPIHLKFIKNCSHLWEKVIVYDSIDV